METQVISDGLQDVVAAETRTSEVDGEAGRLTLAGYPVEVVAPRATYEEMLGLLWMGTLPNGQTHRELREALAGARELPRRTLELLRDAAAQRTDPMDALRMAVSSLAERSTTAEGVASPVPGIPGLALTLVASMPTMVGAYLRLTQEREPAPVSREGRHAAHALQQILGAPPSEAAVRGLETYLNTVIDHGFNASTFTARVIISTRSDLVSAVTGAVGALKGPLHGGAPGPALDTVLEIQRASSRRPIDPNVAERILRAKLERGERLMGFGHRVYRVRDPRADVLGAAADRYFGAAERGETVARFGGGERDVSANRPDPSIYAAAREVEAIALRLLEEHRPGRRLQTNVEFYTALLLHGLGIPSGQFSSIFAIGRVGGWIAHVFEQQALDKLIRPRARYVGPRDLPWTPEDQRRP